MIGRATGSFIITNYGYIIIIIITNYGYIIIIIITNYGYIIIIIITNYGWSITLGSSVCRIRVCHVRFSQLSGSAVVVLLR
jgi:hypothetical protein